MFEFQNDMRDQYKAETSRTVKIVMLTYRCIAVLCMVGLMQLIFAIVTSLIQEKEIAHVLEVISDADKTSEITGKN